LEELIEVIGRILNLDYYFVENQEVTITVEPSVSWMLSAINSWKGHSIKLYPLEEDCTAREDGKLTEYFEELLLAKESTSSLILE